MLWSVCLLFLWRLAERSGRSSVAAMGSAAGHFCKTNKKSGRSSPFCRLTEDLFCAISRRSPSYQKAAKRAVQPIHQSA